MAGEKGQGERGKGAEGKGTWGNSKKGRGKKGAVEKRGQGEKGHFFSKINCSTVDKTLRYYVFILVQQSMFQFATHMACLISS